VNNLHSKFIQITQQSKLRVELDVSSVSSRAVRQVQHSQNAWARHFKRVVSRRDEPSGIWAYKHNFMPVGNVTSPRSAGVYIRTPTRCCVLYHHNRHLLYE